MLLKGERCDINRIRSLVDKVSTVTFCTIPILLLTIILVNAYIFVCKRENIAYKIKTTNVLV